MRPIEVIYLHRNDTLETVRALLSEANAGAQVWVVAPWGWRLMRSLVSLKLIRRTAENAAIDLRLVSRHLSTRALAREAGITVAYVLPPKLRAFRRTRQTDRSGLAARVIAVPGGLGTYWERRRRAFGIGTFFLSLVVIVLLLGIMAGVAAGLMPRAEIRLHPTASPVSGDFIVKANPQYRQVDAERSIIPARVVQVIVEGRGDTPATGRVDLPDRHAEGEIVLVNRTEDPVRVPKGTVVRTGSGAIARFYTVTDVELPGVLFASTRVRIVAIEPGLGGNALPFTVNTVEGEIARLVDVLNDKPTEGGSLKQVPVVAGPDEGTLREDLKNRLQAETYAQLVAGLSAGEFIPKETLEAQEMSWKSDQVVGQQSDVLSMSMKVVVKGVVVEGAALNTLCAQLLEREAAEGMAILADSLVIQPGTEMAVEENVVSFRVSAKGVLAPVVNIDQVKSRIRGKKIAEARAWLQAHLDLRSEPEIRIEPQWWEWIPLLPGRMDVSVSAGDV